MAKTKKPKPITREEARKLPASELSKVATKRRIVASLPSAKAKSRAKKKADDENLTPRQRMERGHAQREQRGEGRGD